jgi:hypothetical protein
MLYLILGAHSLLFYRSMTFYRGNQIVHVEVKIPKPNELTEEQRQHLMKCFELSDAEAEISKGETLSTYYM